MKTTIKIFLFVLTFFVIVPAFTGFVITSLWNGIVTTVCGFAAISFWQGIGLFILSMCLSVGGFLFGLFLIGGIMHVVGHPHEDMGSHWHNMTDEQRREFIERRRREHFRFHKQPHTEGDAAE